MMINTTTLFITLTHHHHHHLLPPPPPLEHQHQQHFHHSHCEQGLSSLNTQPSTHATRPLICALVQGLRFCCQR
jgi:hypothetical protein